jgi:CRISPR/Cas system-associated protein Csm6
MLQATSLFVSIRKTVMIPLTQLDAQFVQQLIQEVYAALQSSVFIE